MEFSTDTARISYDEAINTLSFSGKLRSPDPQVYRKIAELLNKASITNKSSMIWDVRALKDMDSAGLAILYRFVAQQRGNNEYNLKVKANSKVYWQERSLSNLKKIMPRLQLEFFQIQ